MGDTTKLRREIGRLPAGRGRRYSANLKQRLLTAARAGRAAGESWAYLGEELGIPADTLQRWNAEMKPVECRPIAVVAPAMQSEDRDVVVVTPEGFRVEGAVVLVRKLSQ